MNCPTFVNSTICVEANVKINAEVEVGEVDTCCIGRPFMRRCRNQDNKCVCMVYQRMRVRFPLIYSTNVSAHSTGVVCENVDTGQKPCDCYQEPCDCYQEPRGCYQEPRGCCQEPCDCCQKARGCSQELKGCSQELNKCRINHRCRRSQRASKKNRFNCPFVVLAALFCRGRGFRF